MEQIKQLLEVLQSMPEMAIWGLIIWCLYILAKLASIVFAIKAVFTLAINKLHLYKTYKLDVECKKLELEKSKSDIENQSKKIEFEKATLERNKEYASIIKLSKKFDKAKISSVEMESLERLLDVVKEDNIYIHDSSIRNAIKTLSN